MIDFLKGKIWRWAPTHVTLDVNGVGYGIDVSIKTSQQFSQINEEVVINTYLHVKEGILELYGFSTDIEREVFIKIISVSGIGPKIALRVLSEVSSEDLISMITQGNVNALVGLKGIGKKTAEVMIATLRNQFIKLNNSLAARGVEGKSFNSHINDAILALIALGVNETTARKAVDKAIQNVDSKASTSQIISESLKLV